MGGIELYRAGTAQYGTAIGFIGWDTEYFAAHLGRGGLVLGEPPLRGYSRLSPSPVTSTVKVDEFAFTFHLAGFTPGPKRAP